MAYPKMTMISQPLYSAPIKDIPGTVREEIARLDLRGKLPPGSRVAITCGSRGVANIALVIKSIVEEVKALGWTPFLVPAMGSHGGATAAGQVEVLHGYGITEEAMGAPILSSMEVVQLGVTADGLPVFMDKYASEAAATIVVNRVKKHTDFTSHVESGLMKMLVIGLGKHAQALAVHSYGTDGLRRLLPPVARMVIEKAPVLFGLALVEDGLENTTIIRAIPPQEIEQTESELLKKANSYMARLPIDEIDLLLIDRMGKEISGSGMDTNVIGRMEITGEPDFEKPRIKYIAVFDLTAGAHGNAVGVSLADFTVNRLVNKIDMAALKANAITSGFPRRGKIPLTLDTDKEAVDLALRLLGGTLPENARVVRIWDTLHLGHLLVSESLLDEVTQKDGVEIVGAPRELSFTPDDDLEPVDWESWLHS
jgi:hypothetical protein